jgi:hypothetical protein
MPATKPPGRGLRRRELASFRNFSSSAPSKPRNWLCFVGFGSPGRIGPWRPRLACGNWVRFTSQFSQVLCLQQQIGFVASYSRRSVHASPPLPWQHPGATGRPIGPQCPRGGVRFVKSPPPTQSPPSRPHWVRSANLQAPAAREGEFVSSSPRHQPRAQTIPPALGSFRKPPGTRCPRGGVRFVKSPPPTQRPHLSPELGSFRKPPGTRCPRGGVRFVKSPPPTQRPHLSPELGSFRKPSSARFRPPNARLPANSAPFRASLMWKSLIG